MKGTKGKGRPSPPLQKFPFKGRKSRTGEKKGPGWRRVCTGCQSVEKWESEKKDQSLPRTSPWSPVRFRGGRGGKKKLVGGGGGKDGTGLGEFATGKVGRPWERNVGGPEKRTCKGEKGNGA